MIAFSARMILRVEQSNSDKEDGAMELAVYAKFARMQDAQLSCSVKLPWAGSK